MPKPGQKMQDAFNEQVNAEFYSGYMYLSMAAYFESVNLSGFSHWMKIQWQEELDHAMKIYEHLVERGGRVTLKAIDAPPVEWRSPLAAFQAAYEHEVKVTGMINALVGVAHQEDDKTSGAFLQWFITEQAEEEAHTDELVQKLKMIEDSSDSLLMLDKELAQRES